MDTINPFSWLVGWILWHINLCRVFNAKSIFYVNNQFYFKQFSLAWVHSLIVKKHFYFKLFSLFKQLYITIQFSVSTVSMSKTVQFQTIQFSISTQFKCKYSLIVKNISISSQAVVNQLIQFSISTDFVYTQLNVRIILC